MDGKSTVLNLRLRLANGEAIFQIEFWPPLELEQVFAFAAATKGGIDADKLEQLLDGLQLGRKWECRLVELEQGERRRAA